MFAANQSIENGYFRLLYNEEEEDAGLFLAVEHTCRSRAKEIQAMADIVQQTFLPGQINNIP